MKQIKTICTRMNNAAEFDLKVNTAIKEGWTLIKRETILPLSQPHDGQTFIHLMLYAELERFTEPDETEGNPMANLIENLAAFVGNMAERMKQREATEEKKADKTCASCRYEERLGAQVYPCCECTISADGDNRAPSHWKSKETTI